MNDCKYLTSLDVQRYYDGELDSQGVEALEHHLATCPACSAAMEAYAGIGSALRGAFDEALAPEFTARMVRRAREAREQGSRRIALGLLAAASVLFVSSLFLVVYSEADRFHEGSVVAQWEENVVWTPSADDELVDPEPTALYAIHLQRNGSSETGNE